MTIKRLDHTVVVVDDLEDAVTFFSALGLSVEGEGEMEGDWIDKVNGMEGVKVHIVLMRTPDGHGRLELSRFDAPAVLADHRRAPVNALGYLRVMFTVKDLDDCLRRLSRLGAAVVDEVVDYEGVYRLCYIRGPEGILVGLAQEL